MATKLLVEAIGNETDNEKKQGVITEGLAAISGGIASANNVFYNPVQVFNRDLSVIALRAYYLLKLEHAKTVDLKSKEDQPEIGDNTNTQSKNIENDIKLTILEPLAASGLRSIRYALELQDIIKLVVSSDGDPFAAQTIEKNRVRNNASANALEVLCSEANQLMYSTLFGGIEASLSYRINQSDLDNSVPVQLNFYRNRNTVKPGLKRFSVIDLDPYGSVAPFLDAAIQAVEEGGLLCLTSTDMPVLCGNNPEVSFYKYGGTAIKARYMHEMSLRLLLNAVATTAAKYKRVIQPLASCSVDFYVRCFVRVFSSPQKCKFLASKTALVLQCAQCNSFNLVMLGNINQKRPDELRFKVPSMPSGNAYMTECRECGSKKILVGGPFYAGSLHDKKFIQSCLDLISPENAEAFYVKPLTMIPKLRGLLTLIKEELDVPLYYHLPSLINNIKTPTMKLVQFKSALLHLGYLVSHFHREPQSIKTNAPNYVIFDILRRWAETHSPKNPQEIAILSKPYSIDVSKINFNIIHPDAQSKFIDIARWLPNPAPFWGPKPRARRRSLHEEGDSKKAKLPEN